MSTTSVAERPHSITQYIEQAADRADPKVLLELALAETQRVQAEAQKAMAESKAMAEVTFDAKGLRASNMAGLWRMAQIYARSNLVPEHYRGKPEDCFIAIQMAQRMGIDALAYMQASYVVHGRPGIEAKLAIAVANTSGAFKDRIKFHFSGAGKDRRCTAYAHDAQTGERYEQTVSWAMVDAEGWNKDKPMRSGGVQKSKWNTMPDLMFQYRAAMFLIRLQAPEVLMGVKTIDELEDASLSEPTERVSVRAVGTLDELAERLMPSAGNGSEPDGSSAAIADSPTEEPSVESICDQASPDDDAILRREAFKSELREAIALADDAECQRQATALAWYVEQQLLNEEEATAFQDMIQRRRAGLIGTNPGRKAR